MNGRIRILACSVIYGCVALLLACNYFAFQTELFQDEYDTNQPIQSDAGDAVSSPTITWESFDKDHAQKPFVFSALIEIKCIVQLHPIPILTFFEDPPLHLVRDKSPPLLANLI